MRNKERLDANSSLDRLCFVLPEEESRRFVALLDKRPARNPRLEKLMRVSAPWDIPKAGGGGLNDQLNRYAVLQAIRGGIKDLEEGRVHDARIALEELGKKLGVLERT
jgi:hypothetical protein